jgi:hypothetical protein
MILGHPTRHAHTQDFFQAVFAPQPSMRITGITRCHRKTLLPFRKKVRLQKVIGRANAVDSRQAHFFHQAILQGFEQPLDTPFGLRTVRSDPFDLQFL